MFSAWSDPASKARWFAGPDDWESSEYELDFRVGGRERAAGGRPGGPVHLYKASYQDIVENERFVYVYSMSVDETRISVSLATIELKADGAGTRLIVTEQGAFLDGHDNPEQRERGTSNLLDALGRELQRQSGSA